MRKAVATFSAASIIFASNFAFASPMEDELNRIVGTTSAVASPAFYKGNLQSCTIVYQGLIRDFVYKEGGFASVTGNFGIATAGGSSLGVTLKVIVDDYDPLTMTFNPAVLDSALLLSEFDTSAGQLVGGAQSNSGGWNSIFQFDKVGPKLIEDIFKGQVSISFRRHNGGSDVPFVVETRVMRLEKDGTKVIGDDELKKFAECNVKLMENLDKNP